LVLDVRSENEFSGGHINKSKNIPLNQLSNRLAELGQTKIIITVCASGIRSGAAISTLKKAGYTAFNGGSWHNLNKKISIVG
jgi:rhodanese-related sulfurtransferase